MTIEAQKKGRVFFIFILWTLIFVPTSLVRAIGVSPSRINLENIPLDSAVDISVRVSRSINDEIRSFNFKPEGPYARLLRLPQTQLSIPEEELSATFPFVLDTQGLKPGQYQTQLRMLPTDYSMPVATASSSNVVVPGVVVSISFSVTSTLFESLQVRSAAAAISQTHELKMNYFLENTGNLPLTVTHARVHMYEDGQKKGEITFPFKESKKINPRLAVSGSEVTQFDQPIKENATGKVDFLNGNSVVVADVPLPLTIEHNLSADYDKKYIFIRWSVLCLGVGSLGALLSILLRNKRIKT